VSDENPSSDRDSSWLSFRNRRFTREKWPPHENERSRLKLRFILEYTRTRETHKESQSRSLSNGRERERENMDILFELIRYKGKELV